MNFFQNLETQILDFVETPENSKLKAATGSYSTPFRGLLFGEQSAEKVDFLLTKRNVDVLWLGSNPSVKSGLARILDAQADSSHFSTFQSQIKSGMFSQFSTDRAASITSFNPLQSPTYKWELYNRAIKAAGADINAVAMANFIPWGSPDLDSLANQLSQTDRNMWFRMLEFSNHLNVQIVKKLKPKLLIVPRSLGDTASKAPRFLRGLGIVSEEIKKMRRESQLIGRYRQHYLTGLCLRGELEIPIAYFNHPDSLRISSENRQQFIDHFAGVISATMR
jgi:hypothetical protein